MKTSLVFLVWTAFTSSVATCVGISVERYKWQHQAVEQPWAICNNIDFVDHEYGMVHCGCYGRKK